MARASANHQESGFGAPKKAPSAEAVKQSAAPETAVERDAREAAERFKSVAAEFDTELNDLDAELRQRGLREFSVTFEESKVTAIRALEKKCADLQQRFDDKKNDAPIEQLRVYTQCADELEALVKQLRALIMEEMAKLPRLAPDVVSVETEEVKGAGPKPQPAPAGGGAGGPPKPPNFEDIPWQEAAVAKAETFEELFAVIQSANFGEVRVDDWVCSPKQLIDLIKRERASHRSVVMYEDEEYRATFVSPMYGLRAKVEELLKKEPNGGDASIELTQTHESVADYLGLLRTYQFEAIENRRKDVESILPPGKEFADINPEVAREFASALLRLGQYKEMLDTNQFYDRDPRIFSRNARRFGRTVKMHVDAMTALLNRLRDEIAEQRQSAHKQDESPVHSKEVVPGDALADKVQFPGSSQEQNRRNFDMVEIDGSFVVFDEVVANVATFEELYNLLEKFGSVQGSVLEFSVSELRERIESYRRGDADESAVTRAHGLRDVVVRLRNEEQTQAQSKPEEVVGAESSPEPAVPSAEGAPPQASPLPNAVDGARERINAKRKEWAVVRESLNTAKADYEQAVRAWEEAGRPKNSSDDAAIKKEETKKFYDTARVAYIRFLKGNVQEVVAERRAERIAREQAGMTAPDTKASTTLPAAEISSETLQNNFAKRYVLQVRERELAIRKEVTESQRGPVMKLVRKAFEKMTPTDPVLRSRLKWAARGVGLAAITGTAAVFAAPGAAVAAAGLAFATGAVRMGAGIGGAYVGGEISNWLYLKLYANKKSVNFNDTKQGSGLKLTADNLNEERFFEIEDQLRKSADEKDKADSRRKYVVAAGAVVGGGLASIGAGQAFSSVTERMATSGQVAAGGQSVAQEGDYGGMRFGSGGTPESTDIPEVPPVAPPSQALPLSDEAAAEVMRQRIQSAFGTERPTIAEPAPFEHSIAPRSIEITPADGRRGLIGVLEREYREIYNGLTPAQRDRISTLAFREAQANPEVLQSIGIRSGNVNRIYPGEQVSLHRVAEIADRMANEIRGGVRPLPVSPIPPTATPPLPESMPGTVRVTLDTTAEATAAAEMRERIDAATRTLPVESSTESVPATVVTREAVPEVRGEVPEPAVSTEEARTTSAEVLPMSARRLGVTVNEAPTNVSLDGSDVPAPPPAPNVVPPPPAPEEPPVIPPVRSGALRFDGGGEEQAVPVRLSTDLAGRIEAERAAAAAAVEAARIRVPVTPDTSDVTSGEFARVAERVYGSTEAFMTTVQQYADRVSARGRSFFESLIAGSDTAFDKISNTSLETVANIATLPRGELSEVLKDAGISAREYKTWMDEINRMSDALEAEGVSIDSEATVGDLVRHYVLRHRNEMVS